MRSAPHGSRAALGASLLAAALACNTSPSGAGILDRWPRGTPRSSASTLTIGAAGGSLTSTDGGVTLTVAPGALDSGVEFTIQEITSTAPGGLGSAYRIGPDGLALAAPLTLTFQADATKPIASQTVALQSSEGYWLRFRDVVRDPAAGTLSESTLRLGDWSVATGSPDDLQGTFVIRTTVHVPAVVTGVSTLNFAADQGEYRSYLHWASVTAPDAVTVGGEACAPAPAVVDAPTNTAELFSSGTRFDWGVSGFWDLQCTDGSGAPFSSVLDVAFDTLGVNLYRCRLSGGPVISPGRVRGDYTADCGADGTVRATFDFMTCAVAGTCP